MSTDTEVLSIAEAADVLGVKQSTVYAYISRGLLKRHRLPRDRRSWLSRSEVEGFGQRKGTRTLLREDEPTALAEFSQVARLDGDTLLYRERDAVELARTCSYEEVAELLWGQDDAEPVRELEPEVVTAIRRLQDTMPSTSLPLDRLKVTATLLGARDSFRYDLSAPSVVAAARTMAPAFVESLPGPECEPGLPIAERLWGRLTPEPATPEAIAALSAALVLLADHGLGPSTRAVREAAAKAADPYSAVLAGMSVASGLLLGGGSSLAVQAWLGDITAPAAVSRVLEQRLLRGDRLSGFGQPRYRDIDPRAAELLRLLAAAPADPERLAIVEAAIALVRRRRGLEPNVEFALGALCFVHGMAEGAGEAVFVIARTAGWIAHSLETYSTQ
ncbi:MAG TPA: citrate/2-methylcitrate synthase [Amycolatopsis sp.]|nr:citrate/2-methylcitrate synthase [Amycolatopsis sp.]